MAAPLRYIIVGTGGHGAHWCRITLPRLAQLEKAVAVAAVDLNRDALINAQQHLGVPADSCFTDIAEAFEKRSADFAIVVTPPSTHERIIELALIYGLDVLCEKPVADTMEGCARIYRKVAEADRNMMVTMSHRFDQDKQTLEYYVKEGDFGRLNYVVARLTHNCRKWGSWGGKMRHEIPDPLITEGAVHQFDIFRALTGSNAKTVYAATWNPPWGEYKGDSTGLVTFEMENGVHCLYEGAKANASSLSPWSNEYIRVEMENGTLELDHRRIRLLQGEAWTEPTANDLPLLEQEAWANPLLAEQFCDWLRGGPKPATRLSDNIQCMAMTFAAVESARTGLPVDVQTFMKDHLRKAKSAVESSIDAI